jgi:ketosteroid isomerase-like protein
VIALAGFAISFAFPAFAEQKDTADPKIEQQIRAFTMKYDEAFNRSDAAAVAALFSEDRVLSGPHGRFNGRPAIEKFHREQVFGYWHVNNRVTTVDRIISGPDEVSSSGRWSETVRSSLKDVEGTYSWVLVGESDSWKIRRATYTD